MKCAVSGYYQRRFCITIQGGKKLQDLVRLKSVPHFGGKREVWGFVTFSNWINRSKSVLLAMIIPVLDLKKWHVAVRFQDAYFCIVIYSAHKCLSKFIWGTFWSHWVLSFGLLSSHQNVLCQYCHLLQTYRIEHLRIFVLNCWLFGGQLQ